MVALYLTQSKNAIYNFKNYISVKGEAISSKVKGDVATSPKTKAIKANSKGNQVIESGKTGVFSKTTDGVIA